MLAAQASRQGVSVVNVMHGEAFGTFDEPAFSEFGEFMFANAFLGYSGIAKFSKHLLLWEAR